MGPAQIDRADRWFQRYGEPAVLFGRVIPLVRAFVSLPAGIARMPLGPLHRAHPDRLDPLGGGLAFAGKALGSEWENARKYFEYVDYAIVVAVIAGVVYLVVATSRLRAGAAGLSEGLSAPPRGSCWACCRGRPSCCRFLPRHTPCWSPWLLGWPAAQLPPEQAKTFEVALHAGAALGLIIAMPHELLGGLRRAGRARAVARARRQPSASPSSARSSGASAGLPRSPPVCSSGGARHGACRQAPRGRDAAGRATRAAVDGWRSGLAQALRAAPGRLAQRRHARRPRARVASRAAARTTLSWQVGAARDPRRHRAQRPPHGQRGRPPRPRPPAGRRRRRGLRLDTRLLPPAVPQAAGPRPLLGFALYRATLAALVVIAKRQREHLRGPLKSKKKVPLTRF